jgi:WXG100 family type VII secretion target
MSDQLVYNHEAIEAFVGKAKGLVGQLNDQRNTLKSQIGTLEGSWTGAAQQNMSAAFVDMGKDIDNLNGILEAVHQAVQKGSNDMQDLDKQLAGGWAV